MTQYSYHKALVTMCRSRVFLLSELLREMNRIGVRVDLNDKVR